MAVGLVIAVVAVAYGSQAPVLGVAEFAPAARQAVEPPPTTAADPAASGARAGGRQAPTTTALAAATTATTIDPGSAAAPTTQVPRGRACVGSPPRQIEDPMSPPCIGVVFEGDNGGATSTGVTGTEIAVAIPHDGWCDAVDCQPRITALFEFFNQRFEFYGRRLRPVFVNAADNDPPAARAAAAGIADQHVFATLTGAAEWNEAAQAFFQELGRQQIVTVMRGVSVSDRTLLDELHPYLWASHPSTEQWQRAIADFGCRSLAGRAARFAGTAEQQATTRKFGVIAAGGHQAPPARDLVDGLRACGQQVESFQWTGSTSTTAQLRAGLEAFRSAGVTTIACVCSGWWWYNALGGLAQLSGYVPEILNPLPSEPSEEFWRHVPYRSTLFGPTPRPKVGPVQAQPWFQALVAVNPAIVATGSNGLSAAKLTYELLLILSSGIQGAGPRLTPDSFAAALMSTQFANAGAGQAPYWQPSVGFGPGDHSFYSDYALGWWSDQADAVEPESGQAKGSWCYAGAGARFATGAFPTDGEAMLFDSAQLCR